MTGLPKLSALDDSTPAALKKYTLLGKLATGGMAELFLARANGLGGFERLLVIKRILPSLAGDTEFVSMLLDEARISATLQHSNIVQVFDVDMDGGQVFFVMEHLHGQHVAELLRRAEAAQMRIPVENAVAVAVAVAAGLHYAHERWGADGKPLEIVHRDVSPNNVVITYDGNVKLIDFGIAKASGRLSHTRYGIFKGKLPYAAPEQCRCEPIDRRTDVYSLGVMLYELTTGHPCFSASNEYELLRVMSEAVITRPRMLDKAYPRELEQIVLKALAKDPAERYPTAQALQRDLEVYAAREKMDVSAWSLSRLMAGLFEAELAQWSDSRKQGLKLEQHITRRIAAQPEPAETEPTESGEARETRNLRAQSRDEPEQDGDTFEVVEPEPEPEPVTAVAAVEQPVIDTTAFLEVPPTVITRPKTLRKVLGVGALAVATFVIALVIASSTREVKIEPTSAKAAPAPVASVTPIAEPAVIELKPESPTPTLTPTPTPTQAEMAPVVEVDPAPVVKHVVAKHAVVTHQVAKKHVATPAPATDDDVLPPGVAP